MRPIFVEQKQKSIIVPEEISERENKKNSDQTIKILRFFHMASNR